MYNVIKYTIHGIFCNNNDKRKVTQKNKIQRREFFYIVEHCIMTTNNPIWQSIFPVFKNLSDYSN